MRVALLYQSVISHMRPRPTCSLIDIVVVEELFDGYMTDLDALQGALCHVGVLHWMVYPLRDQ